MTNSVFRAYRYGANDPIFAGKKLTPKGTITEMADRGEIKIVQPAPKGGKAKKGGKK
jgi:hypothetical protein